MKTNYLEEGLSEELFWETIIDLKYKLYECKEVKGVLIFDGEKIINKNIEMNE